MWNPEKQIEFEENIGDLLNRKDVQQMDCFQQHAQGISCLDHCIFVAYLSFIICRRFGMDYRSAARAALMHDMYLCDWSRTDIGRWKRLFIHPELALKNAAEAYALSDLEKDIIVNHMWPLTPRKIPRSREAIVVNFADKVCATAEMLRIYRLIKVGDGLLSFNRRKFAMQMAG